MNPSRVITTCVVVVVAFAAAVIASISKGTPDSLPDAALGWPVLLHVLRASALLGAVGIVGLVGWKAANGEFPIKFGAVEYSDKAKEADEATAAATDAQERRLRYLEALQGIGSPPPPPEE